MFVKNWLRGSLRYYVLLPVSVVAIALWLALAVAPGTGAAQGGFRPIVSDERIELQMDDASAQFYKFRDGNVTCYVGIVDGTFNTLLSCVK